MNQKINNRKVINYAGAFIALLIGSGFATGQELMQYFASYGYLGMLGVLICFVMMAFVGVEFVRAGYQEKFENPNDVYKYFCGDILGKFYDYFSIFFIFLSYMVMVAGAQATAVEHFNAPANIGGLILAAAAILTVIFGLKGIVEVIGNIGPVVIVLAVIVGGISCVKNFSEISVATENLKIAQEAGIMKMASSNFLFAVGSYVGFCLLWLAAFLAQIGKNANSLEEGRRGAILGALGFSIATLIMSFAIFLSIGKVHDSQIPGLLLAKEISPILANIFSIMILLGIYTTAVPLLWTVIARFAKEKTNKYRILTIVLGVIGAFIGLKIEFSQLVNYVYVLNGYVGLIMIFIMVYKYIQRKVKK